MVMVENETAADVTAAKLGAIVCRNGHRVADGVHTDDDEVLTRFAELAHEDVCWHQERPNEKLTILLRVKDGTAKGIIRLREAGKPGALPFTAQAMRGLVGIPHLVTEDELKLSATQLGLMVRLIMNGEIKIEGHHIKLATGKRLAASG